MSVFIKFPDIQQFRDAVYSVKQRAQYTGKNANGEATYDHELPCPTIEFTGSVKLHGTNMSIANDGYETWTQSRNGIIFPGGDNDPHNFVGFLSTKMEVIDKFFTDTRAKLGVEPGAVLVIYGEYCGEGIMKKVSINNLPKMFVGFAIATALDNDNKVFLNPDDTKDVLSTFVQTELCLRSIYEFEQHKITINFNSPKDSLDGMVTILSGVEAECPVGKALGVVKGEVKYVIGEGNVWVGFWNGERIAFKIKGDEHKVTKTREVIPIDYEKLESINEFTTITLTEARIQQGLDEVSKGQPLRVEMTGEFLKWIVNDVLKEETQLMVENNLDKKEVTKALSIAARQMLLTKLNDF